MNAAELNLEQLLQPIAVEAFFAQYWERRPLLLQRRGAQFYDSLLRLADIEDFISRGDTRYPAVRLAKGGSFFPPEAYTQDVRYGDEVFRGLIDIEKLFTEYSSGATITLPALHRAWPPLGRLCAQIEAELDHSVHTNGYLTPANATGFTPHYDTHEVLVLQIAGTKQWRVYPPPLQTPHRSQVFSAETYRPPATALMECELAAGDLLYLPRGHVHTTRTAGQFSAHVTIGITVYTWLELLSELVQSGSDAVELRAALPPGFAHRPEQQALLRQRLPALLEQLRTMDADAVIERFTRRVHTARGRPAVAFNADAAVIGPDSRLRLVPGRRYALSSEGHDLLFVVDGRRLRLQAAVRPTLETICAAVAFTPRTLPSTISLDARMTLVRYLYGLGVLMPVTADDTF